MNPDQLAAVRSQAPWNIVLAGPGSGKSTVIIQRAAHLKSEGVDPSRMAFVTFTSVGAKVLKTRLQDAVGKVGFAGTLHAMMLMLLRRADPRWVMVSEEDSDEFLARQADLLGYRGTREELESQRSRPIKEITAAARVVQAYRQFMREERLLDFDMVLTEGLKLMGTAGFQNPWTHWFVDEFQDSAQVDAAIYLAADPDQLFVVGDSDQSIFRFRGARPENVTDFWNMPRFTRHVLSLNYRCAAEFCDVANAVVDRIPHRIEKKTESALGQGGVLTSSEFGSDEQERSAIAAGVAERIASGTPPHEIAILCRTNATVAAMKLALKAANIPVAEVEQPKKPKDWRLLMMILQQIATPESWANARLLAREMARIKKSDIAVAEKAVEQARAAGKRPNDAWLFPALGVVLSLNADLSRFGVSRASHELLAQRIRMFRPDTIEELLECLRASPEAVSVRGVNVCTVHAAKGEEWTAVFVAGADQFRSATEMDDERRLFFVAVTRAKRFLHVSCAHQRIVTTRPGFSTIVESPSGELFEIVEDAALTTTLHVAGNDV